MTFTTTSLIWALLLYSRHITELFAPDIPQTFHPNNAAYYGKFVGTSELLNCGNTTADAKRRGCKYDILSNHWVPPLCWDQYSVEEYQADGSWFGFADEERNQILTIEEMSEMEFYYTNLRDHIVHCAMLWKKQFRAFADERPNIDTVIADEEHTMHCAQFLIDMSENGPDYKSIPIKVFVGYAGCWAKEPFSP